MKNLFIVIPCYNEEKKLLTSEIVDFVKQSSAKIIFVNDGSTDKTLEKLEEIKEQIPDNIHIISNAKNIGKGNSVREGVHLALKDVCCEYIGYFDADLSAPLDEASRLSQIAIKENKGFIMGSRVALFGYQIKRKPLRHYLGRIVATIISLYLKMQVYDTQCGAKILKREFAARVFKDPFLSRWLFDVEILRRLQMDMGNLDEVVKEVPLNVWIEKGESKLNFLDLIKVPIDLVSIMIHYRKI
ncbi:glycosyltransferase [Aquiflexum sp.]|uniref:glycosyltransferase n=1 Tax=Aquiflexum sp. TaxID=1872584 RepID=UPI003593BCB2